MRKLSTGADSTLGNWEKLVAAVFGEGPALDLIHKKISESEKGKNEEVIVDERQLIMVLSNLQYADKDRDITQSG